MQKLICGKGWNAAITGVFGLLLILLVGVLFGSTVGFIEEGISDMYPSETIGDAIFDYYFKPFYWILLFGIIPTIITGTLIGVVIRDSRQF